MEMWLNLMTHFGEKAVEIKRENLSKFKHKITRSDSLNLPFPGFSSLLCFLFLSNELSNFFTRGFFSLYLMEYYKTAEMNGLIVSSRYLSDFFSSKF